MGSATSPSVAWIGFHSEGIPTLRWLLDTGRPPKCVITLSTEAASRRSGVAPVAEIARHHGLPLLETKDVNSPESVDFLTAHAPDLLLVLGWSQILKSEVLSIPRIGAAGAHASLLPDDRGSAPVNWAIIRGYRESGNTLIWLMEGVDTGDVIAQRRFSIDPWDTCASVYDKVASTNQEMVAELLSELSAGRKPAIAQPQSPTEILPRRRPSDGEIDWNRSAVEVYNFIRALTHPYPGAFTVTNGSTAFVWAASLPPVSTVGGAPGTVLGVVHSPIPEAVGVAVSCGEGFVQLLEVEIEGKTLTGYELVDALPAGSLLG